MTTSPAHPPSAAAGRLDFRSPNAADRPGTRIRRARQAEGWTLAELGARCGYSAAQLSRLERGLAPLTVEVLWRFADVLGLPPQDLGLAPVAVPDRRHGRVGAVKCSPIEIRAPSVVREQDGPGGREDQVRRRQMLTGTAGAAAWLVLGSATGARADRVGGGPGESALW